MLALPWRLPLLRNHDLRSKTRKFQQRINGFPAHLDCRRFKGRHSADNIVAAFDEILEEYNINDKVEFIITDNASNMKKAFKFVMAEEINHSLQTDTSTSDQSQRVYQIQSDRTLRSYLGVTAHVCNSTANEYTLKSFLLDCRRFKGRHSADNIVAAFDEILEEYNINDKVEFIITDNASNMKKAFKFVMAEDHSDDSEDEEDMVGEPLDRNFTLGSRQRLSCFAHSLQLVVGDGLKEVKCLSQAMSKVSKLATLLHSSTIFKDKFEAVFGNGKSIPVATVTRWNSTFKQIKAITELDHTTLTEMCSPDFKNVVITTREWAQLRELCLILGPFAEATELTDGEKIITISMVVPTVLDLNTHLIQMDSPKSLCRPLIRALRESLQQRFSGIFIALHMKHSTPTEASIVTQVIKYFEHIQSSPIEEDPLMFWAHNKDKYPHLHTLALKVLSVPASSAPVERVFSAGGLLMRPHRASLGSKMLSSLIFLKCNNGLL
uniref:HAT C-terminal dimerisation domain-containing protein n=1 Tax=Sinocyclocheilus anshuiensis TaxID=1608454 RepID=A0A671NDY4_9TELE